MGKLIEKLKTINSINELNSEELSELKGKSVGFEALPEELLDKVTGGDAYCMEDGICECGGTIWYYFIGDAHNATFWRSCRECGKVYGKGNFNR